MNKRSSKKKKKNTANKPIGNYIQTRSRMRLRRMKGGNNNDESRQHSDNTAMPSSSLVADAVRSVSQGGEINTLINSNHLPIIPFNNSGVSPLPAGPNTRDILFGGTWKSRGRGWMRLNKCLDNKKSRSRRNVYKKYVKKQQKTRKYKGIKPRMTKGGGDVEPFLPNDLTNFTDSLKGAFIGTLDAYKGTETPYQVNHTYPYQQEPQVMSYNTSITDANAMYNKADNIILSKFN